MSHERLSLASRCIHGGQHPDPTTGAVMPPIYTSSTFIQDSPGVHKGFEYTRSHNATRFALERAMGDLESSGLSEADDRTCGGFAFASGLAAIATALELMGGSERPLPARERGRGERARRGLSAPARRR